MSARRLRSRRSPRRWDLSADELDQIAAARTGSLGARGVLGLVARNPRLVSELARTTAGSVRDGIFGNNSLTALLGAERARQAVPDAATGVGWHDEKPFLTALTPCLSGTVDALELGCGSGRISRHVAPLVRELVCTDLSPTMIAEARENLSAFSNVRLAVTDGFALPEFADTSFDVVLGQGVLGYLRPNQLLGLLAEVRRVLRPGGVSLFNFFTIDGPEDAAHHLSTVLEQARKRRPHGGLDEAYTHAGLETMHVVAGLAVAPEVEADAKLRGERVVIVGRREES